MCADITKKKKHRKCRLPYRRHYTNPDLARMHLSRKQHTHFLARPNFRYLLDIEMRRRKKNWPNKNACLPMYPIARATLRAKTTKRTEILAAPHVSNYELEKAKYVHDQMLMKMEDRRAEQEQLPEHYVMPAALRARATKRVEFLSYPKMLYAESQVKDFGPLLGKKFEDKMIEYVKKSPMYLDAEKKKDKKYESFHIRSHRSFETISTVSTIPLARKKRFKPMKKEEYEEWLNNIAAARELHKPPPPKKKKRLKLAQLMPRIQNLAKPTKEYEKIDEEQFFTVKRLALKYRATPRIKYISQPRALEFEEEIEPPELTQHGVISRALTAIATPQTIKLSKAVERKSKVTEEYEFAFKVKPEALKAKCTKRTKELARPVER